MALAPLLIASAAHAQVSISNTRTVPVLTSTADGTNADDITLTGDGAIKLASGVALTGDSDNDIVLEDDSVILMDESEDGSTGVLLQGGYTGDLTVAGSISVIDDLDTYEDEDGDGDADGPFATGSDRYGIRVAGDGVRTGDILIEDTGSITVEGDSSYGLSLESDLIGSITAFGSLSVVGDDSLAIRLMGDVDGDVLLSGSSVYALGENAVALSIEGAISGTLQIQSSITSTGYRYTTSPTALADYEEDVVADIDLSDSTLYLEDLDADDLLQGGSAVIVAGDVAGGILLGAAPTYDEDDEDDDGDGVVNSEDDDVDGDGIDDDNEGTASIITYGGAPALLIGSATQDVGIGAVGTGDDAWGLINQGTIAAYGVYDDVATTALQIGLDGGFSTALEGGIWNDGTILSSSVEADATGLLVESGGVVPTLLNDSVIEAIATTEGEDVATALLIAEGGSLTSLVNNGSIFSVIYGEAGDAVAIRDASGSLSSIVNTGAIYGTISATDSVTDTDDDNTDTDDEVITGREIAMDLSANTTGVSIIQYGVSDGSETDTDGDDVYDDVDTDDDGDGILDADDDDDNDDDNDGVYDADEAYIYGDILLGSGDDAVDIRNGVVVGDLSFGDGADQFLLSGGSTYQGVLSDSDGLLDISISGGATLDGRQTETLDVSSLTLSDGAELIVTLDPATGAIGGYNVSGTASLSADSLLGVRLNSLIDESQRFTVITAGDLDYASEGTLTGSTPYMVVAEIGADADTSSVYVDVRKRTTTEMSLSGVETAAYDAFYQALGLDEDVMDAFLATETREDFINLYEQTLPDHSGGTLMALSSGVDAVTQALAGRNAVLAPGEVSGWAQQINFYADKDKTDTYGYRTEGFGFAGGVERGTGLGVVGVSIAMTSSDIEDPESEAEEVLSASLVELGVYWRAQGRGWSTWARAAAGYATFDSVRTLVGDDVYLSNEAEWDGYTLSAAAGVAYEKRFGRLSLRPEAYAEIFSLSESSRTESGGGDAFDLAIEGRDGMIASGTTALNIGYGFGENGWIRPELKLGWKQTLASDAGETIARYVSGGSSFILESDAVSGGGPLLGFGLTIGNALGSLSVSGDAQLLEDYVRYSFLLRASFVF